MSKSIDLGKTLKETLSPPAPIDLDEPQYPELRIESEDPKIADMPNKGECTIKYRVVSRTHREEGRSKKHRSCSLLLQVTSIEPPHKAKNRNGYGDDARKAASDYFKDK